MHCLSNLRCPSPDFGSPVVLEQATRPPHSALRDLPKMEQARSIQNLVSHRMAASLVVALISASEVQVIASINACCSAPATASHQRSAAASYHFSPPGSISSDTQKALDFEKREQIKWLQVLVTGHHWTVDCRELSLDCLTVRRS